MHDGRTRQLERKSESAPCPFFERYRATLVLLAGPAAGSEYAIEAAPSTIGRGPETDLCFDDNAMSREHAVFELGDAGLRIRDLASRNGVIVNGAEGLVADLKHGDRIELGEHRFQLVVEERDAAPQTYDLGDTEA